MADVSIRELRNSGGEVVDRAARGEPIRITRALSPPGFSAGRRTRSRTSCALLERWRNLPKVDPIALRRDLDQVLDPEV
jgi:antitoxin (DNA-binding transcriptional repressor) of toxin-antitoxin stability system